MRNDTISGTSVGKNNFFFNDAATTEIYTLSLHDALPICCPAKRLPHGDVGVGGRLTDLARQDVNLDEPRPMRADRKSTRLNSSHANISYAAFCLKKKNHSHLVMLVYATPAISLALTVLSP